MKFDECLWHGTAGIANKNLNEDGFCPECLKRMDKLRNTFPQVLEINLKYLNLMKEAVEAGKLICNPLLSRFIPKSISSWHMTFHNEIINDIWDLNLPPDPNCVNLCNGGGRGYDHWASAVGSATDGTIGSRGYCGYCYCRTTRM